MATLQDTAEDPLIAALPPATDYITYLTLLEYQLKPENLSTLNTLLSDDDGTLASEIGWDLLKLVLPMLQIIPEEANKCLSIIARRGNPREVAVRVAEELERLGQADEQEDEDFESGPDGLPTFAGEAPRIHLGELKLEGMPPPKESSHTPEVPGSVDGDRRVSIGGESGSDDILIFQALLSMLSIVHPRIKTQYPSRFLATSLPAALGTYRRLRVSVETTTAFVDFLTRMAGRKRPALPPRTSTTGSIPTSAVEQASAPAPPIQAPPLPDPEAKVEPPSTGVGTDLNEKAIIQRLLQAVMLEVLDEYTASFQTTSQPSMNWTARLREKHEPRRVLPNRPTEIQRWTQSTELKSRDEIVAKFLRLSKDLSIDTGNEIMRLIEPVRDDDMEPDIQTESDYPTSPSQIPFTSLGLILLFAAQNFAQDVTGLTSVPGLPLTAVRSIFATTFAPSEELPHLPSLSQTDALLSLIYTTLQSPLSQPAPQSTVTAKLSSPQSSPIDFPFLTNLTNLFITSPDPQIRDSTHHITTLILHNHTDSNTKLLYIKSLLSPHLSPTSPVHDIQQGNLRALAINWLKDEFLSYHDVPEVTTVAQSVPTDASDAANIPLQPPTLQAAPSTDQSGLNPEMMHTDPDLVSLIFPDLPNTPSPFLSGGEPLPTTSPSMSSETDLETLLLRVPAYIASLNLLCILGALPSNKQEHESILSSHPPNADLNANVLLERSTRFLHSVNAWQDLLLGFTTGLAQNQALNGGESGPVNVSDVYALEDAVNRAKATVAELS